MDRRGRVTPPRERLAYDSYDSHRHPGAGDGQSENENSLLRLGLLSGSALCLGMLGLSRSDPRVTSERHATVVHVCYSRIAQRNLHIVVASRIAATRN